MGGSSEWALRYYKYVSLKMGNLNTETDTCTEGRQCEETQGKDSHLQAQECLGLPEARREGCRDPYLVPSEGECPCQQRKFRLLATRTV